MATNFLQDIVTTADRLRALDTRHVVFGASQHAYRFNPPLATAQVEAFEQHHKVVLPEPYRQFITEIGNGGVGPYYGIMPLDPQAPQLQQPFPATQPFELDDDKFNEDIPGALVLAEYGCGIYIVLVVHGEAAGEVWVDARYEGGISPITDANGQRMTFDVWWLSMMGRHLATFEHILALMQAGTPHETIHQNLEPSVIQLEVDQIMLSLMDQDPTQTPKVYANKPWGRECGLVEDHYANWLQNKHSTGN